MYNLKHFKAADEKEVMDFMHQHPFVLLCGVDKNNQPVATHVPVLFEQRGDKLFLLAHVMRKQDHTNAFEQNPNVLVIFYEAHSYVSASWYEQKEVASTWNYRAVHARGVLKFLDDAGLYNVLKKLTAHFENDPHSPALVEKMDEAYVHNNMKAIIAFEIEITSIDHVFKISQNRDAKTYENIIDHLKEGNAEDKSVATVMEENKHNVFPS